MGSQHLSNVPVKLQTEDQFSLDNTRLLKVFPGEIWELILKNVKDLKNFKNLSNSSAFFHERLLSKRTIFLFPVVFELLIESYQDCYQLFSQKIDYLQDFDSERYNNDKDNVTSLLQKVPWRCLRLVCQDWNNIIVEFFQMSKVKPFLKKEYRWVNSSKDCIRELMLLCAKYGPMVKSFRFWTRFGTTTDSLAKKYLLLVKFLRYFPNLKSLEISHNTIMDISVDTQLAQMIERNPCTKLKFLEKLYINGNLPSQICAEVLRQNCGIKSLKLFREHFTPNYTFDFSTKLPNLVDLSIRVLLDHEFEQLKQFGKNLKLKKFLGDFRVFTEKTVWVSIFKMLGDYWGDTLEQFQLHFPPPSSRDVLAVNERLEQILSLTMDQRLLKLKMLKRVWITTYSAISLDFLLTCQENLEVIHIHAYGPFWESSKQTKIYENTMNQQLVHYLGLETKMEKSNIWSLFPKLVSYSDRMNNVLRPAK